MLGKYIQSSVLAKRVDPGWIWLVISIVIGSIFSTSTNSDDRIVNGSVQTSLKQETMGHYQLTKVNLQRALVVAKTSNNQVKTASILGSLGNLSIS